VRLIQQVGEWVSRVKEPLNIALEKVTDLLDHATKLADLYQKGKDMMANVDDTVQPVRPSKTSTRPNFLGTEHSDNHRDEISQLVVLIDGYAKQLQSVESENKRGHDKIALQIAVVELITSNQIGNFINNLRIHASNLRIHLQTIQNTAGLLDDINRQRTGIKATIGTLNRVLNEFKNEGLLGNVELISGIDLGIKDGSISIRDAYRHFENTRKLIEAEISACLSFIDKQFETVDNLRNYASRVPHMSVQTSNWLENDIVVSLRAFKKDAESLKGQISVIPRMQSEIRRYIEEQRDIDAEIPSSQNSLET